MTQAQSGDTVKVHYTGKLNDGSVFDSSLEGEPLTFTLDAGELIPGFERAVLGMAPGQSKQVTLPAAEAYGPHLDDLVFVVPRDQLPESLALEVGQSLQLSQPDGQTFWVTVLKVDADRVTLDGNHPLAGKDLTFEIQLVEIVPPAPGE